MRTRKLNSAILLPLYVCLFILSLISGGCATCRNHGEAGNTLTQVSTIDALLAGSYDGQVSLKSLLREGDFGIGTFQGLDGEMVLLDGKVYQVSWIFDIRSAPEADMQVGMASKGMRLPLIVCHRGI